MAKKKGLPNDFVVRQLLLSLNEKLLSNPRSPVQGESAMLLLFFLLNAVF